MSATSTREKPSQKRAQARLEKILSVAEKMMLETGFDEFKMNSLSQKADVNIATIYRYFPNKTSLAMELLDGYLTEYRKQLKGQLLDLKSNNVNDVVDLLVDGYLHFYQENPAFVAIWKGLSGTQAYKQKDVADSHHNACVLCELTKPHFPDINEEQLTEVLFLICEVAGNLMPTILVLEGKKADNFTRHLKKMIGSYMAELFRS